MSNLKTENLFLLEFLVDDLRMDPKCDCMSPGEVCVSFQFLDNEGLDVCEKDFEDKKFGDNNKTGKSCLFSLTPIQAKRVMTSFDVTVNVFKKMQPGWQPERSCIGTSKVPILPLFLELVNSKDPAAASKVLQDTFPINDSKGKIVGRIAVYIRLSCYGKMIITQFQMNMDDKSVLFKDKDGRSLYRYKKTRKGKTTKIEDLSGGCTPTCPPPQPYEQQMYGMPPGMAFPQQPPPPPQNQMYPPPNMNCPMQPCFPPQGFQPQMPMQQNYPPPNLNCPMQPCFPDYGQSAMDMGACPAPPRGCQQVSFAESSRRRNGCGGGCGGRF